MKTLSIKEAMVKAAVVDWDDLFCEWLLRDYDIEHFQERIVS
jgi:hypothetical protein